MKSAIEKIKLGVSVYLHNFWDDAQKVERYLEQAADMGYTEVFSSIHLPEDDFDTTLKMLSAFSSTVSKKGMNLGIDCSFHEFKKIQTDPILIDEIKQASVKFLRLDFGFQADDLKYIVNDLGIHGLMLNASIMHQEELVQFLDKTATISSEIKLKACHNFYPRPETGLSLEYFLAQSSMFQKYEIPVIACVPAYKAPRAPLHLGLPTLEKHRSKTMKQAAQELIATNLVNEILIGDPYASYEELAVLRQAIEGDCLDVLMNEDDAISEAEREIAYGPTHEIRPDLSEYVIRSNSSREMAAMGPRIAPRQPKERKKFSVTIDNTNYGRYSGEMQIVLHDLPADPRVNVIGEINHEDVELISYLMRGQKFKLIKND